MRRGEQLPRLEGLQVVAGIFDCSSRSTLRCSMSATSRSAIASTGHLGQQGQRHYAGPSAAPSVARRRAAPLVQDVRQS